MKKHKKLIIAIVILSFVFVLISIYLPHKFSFNYIKVNGDSDIIVADQSGNRIVVASKNGEFKIYDNDLNVTNEFVFTDFKDITVYKGFILIVKSDGTLWEYNYNISSAPIQVLKINNVAKAYATYKYCIYEDKNGDMYYFERDCENSFGSFPYYTKETVPIKIKNSKNLRICAIEFNRVAFLDNNYKLYVTDEEKLFDDNGNINLIEKLKNKRIKSFSFAIGAGCAFDNSDSYYQISTAKYDKIYYQSKFNHDIKKIVDCQNTYALDDKGNLYEWGLYSSTISHQEYVHDVPNKVITFKKFDDIYATHGALFARKGNKLFKVEYK